ncbi:DUF4259 domain-containing protein [Catenuloplanes japonicus]|uniref:DUF4259 domain-containing protein n=1 Tax=Catenuloplanes japonicus TaxID=33876 RepID=UPI000526E9CF|nr:DUF4259 domain-containing protein [Catenuloplanes japonicus]
MGTWDTGPFDNDGAGDWLADLRHASAADRPGLLLDALRNVTDEPEYVEVDTAQAALAAAAVLAGEVPDFLADSPLTLPAGTDALAVRALDRIMGPDSEWHELWSDDSSDPDDAKAAFAVVQALRLRLTAA